MCVCARVCIACGVCTCVYLRVSLCASGCVCCGPVARLLLNFYSLGLILLGAYSYGRSFGVPNRTAICGLWLGYLLGYRVHLYRALGGHRLETRLETRLEARLQTRLETRLETRLKMRLEMRLETRLETRLKMHREATLQVDPVFIGRFSGIRIPLRSRRCPTDKI